ncbi:hypothetical protein NADFUDRAFT_41374 [Nadsonia fulvescens var. elongata DSM 6958]|uniref:Nucleotide exchange factor SIL1 n=1 Tax=Nadsonia fulvescens var. elongata DSM 6958 TaxID=857566 RepID=A0A1E3PMT0_9ASCO|nr:hypothetical protein NADFUDRAFT_41374 [Nadsonia fulvescens var. elongata DSM 6958]
MDCYPKIFEPATYWQTIRDDQEIPAGLYVRVNMATGLKEAKFLDSEEDDKSLELLYPEGDTPISDEITVVVGERDQDTYENNQKFIHTDTNIDVETNSKASRADADFDFDVEGFLAQLPVAPKEYSHKPNLRIPASDHSLFKDSLAVISQPSTVSRDDLIKALSTLAELAHELDFGISIAKAPNAIKDILALTSFSLSSSVEVRELTARIIGAALYNNPTAQRSAPLAQIVQTTLNNLESEPDALVRTRLVYVLSSVVASPYNHEGDVHADGLSVRDSHSRSPIGQYALLDGGATLRALFRDSASTTNAFKAKCATFVQDTFANPDIYDNELDFNLRVRNTDELMDKGEINEKSAGWWMDESMAWAVKFQDSLTAHSNSGMTKLDSDARDKIYSALKSIHTQFPSLKVSEPFINWMIGVAKGSRAPSGLKARDIDADEFDDEVLFANMINEDRHVFFGNPNGYRKNMPLDII